MLPPRETRVADIAGFIDAIVPGRAELTESLGLLEAAGGAGNDGLPKGRVDEVGDAANGAAFRIRAGILSRLLHGEHGEVGTPRPDHSEDEAEERGQRRGRRQQHRCCLSPSSLLPSSLPLTH